MSKNRHSENLTIEVVGGNQKVIVSENLEVETKIETPTLEVDTVSVRDETRITVTSPTTFNQSVIIDTDLTVSDDLTVTDNATINGDVTLSNSSDLVLKHGTGGIRNDMFGAQSVNVYTYSTIVSVETGTEIVVPLGGIGFTSNAVIFSANGFIGNAAGNEWYSPEYDAAGGSGDFRWCLAWRDSLVGFLITFTGADWPASPENRLLRLSIWYS